MYNPPKSSSMFQLSVLEKDKVMQRGEEEATYKMNKNNAEITKAQYLKDLNKLKTNLSGRISSLHKRYNNYDFKGDKNLL